MQLTATITVAKQLIACAIIISHTSRKSVRGMCSRTTTSRPRPRPVPFGVSNVSRAKVAVDVAKVDVVAAGQPTVSFIDVKKRSNKNKKCLKT